MERKIGEIFEFEGHKLKVVDEGTCKCNECLFYRRECSLIRNAIGSCSEVHRTDKKSVIFVEVKDEQPLELNLCEILKNCPIGTKFWSPLLGEVELSFVHDSYISVRYHTGGIWDINSDGTMTLGSVTSPEIMLFPSREQRDWTKVKYEPKKERFNPKTLNPFDKVLVRNDKDYAWYINIYSHKNNHDKNYPYNCIMSYFKYCIPYNDDTKHLVGTTEEAPKFYKYWED